MRNLARVKFRRRGSFNTVWLGSGVTEFTVQKRTVKMRSQLCTEVRWQADGAGGVMESTATQLAGCTEQDAAGNRVDKVQCFRIPTVTVIRTY